MRREKSCGGLVFRADGDKIQILLIRHRLGGQWSFPKGHMEEGESERQTALREILEETGLSVRLLRGFRESIRYCPCPEVRKQVVYFIALAPWEEPTPPPEEIRAAAWFDLERVPYKLRFRNDRRLVAKAVKRLKFERNLGLPLDKRGKK